MKPDDHKKKKNAAYKKKHGIGTKSTSSTSAENVNTPGKKFKPKDQQRGSIKDGAASSTSKTSNNKPSGSSDSSDSDSEVIERKSFRRRQIVSNWEKYELEPESDEKLTSRGEDFNKLLNMAGEAMSHFRFKEELEWDDGIDKDSDLSDSNFLTLDLEDISSSMSCIPIHHLLGIDPSLFPKEQLEAHMKSTDEKRNLYFNSINSDDSKLKQTQAQNKQSTSNQLKKVSHKTTLETNNNPIINRKNKEPENFVTKTENGKFETNETPPVKPSCDSDGKYKHESNEGKDVYYLPGVGASNEEHSMPPLSLQDDALDELFNNYVGQGDRRSKNEEPPDPMTDDLEECGKLEDWLESVLD